MLVYRTPLTLLHKRIWHFSSILEQQILCNRVKAGSARELS